MTTPQTTKAQRDEWRKDYDPMMPAYALLIDAEALAEHLRALIEVIAESDPYPTSDAHPLYAARKFLEEWEK